VVSGKSNRIESIEIGSFLNRPALLSGHASDNRLTRYKPSGRLWSMYPLSMRASHR